jgi:hypothetical protein
MEARERGSRGTAAPSSETSLSEEDTAKLQEALTPKEQADTSRRRGQFAKMFPRNSPRARSAASHGSCRF